MLLFSPCKTKDCQFTVAYFQANRRMVQGLWPKCALTGCIQVSRRSIPVKWWLEDCCWDDKTIFTSRPTAASDVVTRVFTMQECNSRQFADPGFCHSMYSYSLVLQNPKCLLALCLFRDLSKFAIITITNNQYSISNTNTNIKGTKYFIALSAKKGSQNFGFYSTGVMKGLRQIRRCRHSNY